MCFSVHVKGSKWDLTHDGIVADKSDYYAQEQQGVGSVFLQTGTNTS